MKLVLVFEVLDHEEAHRSQKREPETDEHQSLLGTLGEVHCGGHRKRAQDQNRRVDSTHHRVQILAGIGEHFRIIRPKNGVEREECSEEEDFGTEKQPHPELDRLVLLLRSVEMVCLKRIVMMTVVIMITVIMAFLWFGIYRSHCRPLEGTGRPGSNIVTLGIIIGPLHHVTTLFFIPTHHTEVVAIADLRSGLEVVMRGRRGALPLEASTTPGIGGGLASEEERVHRDTSRSGRSPRP